MQLNNYTKHAVTKPLGIQTPSTLTIAITDHCNQHCSHCWVAPDSKRAAFQVPEWSLLQIIEQFASLDGEHIRLTGGEPLLHPGCLRALQFAATIGITSISLQTNALLLTDQKITQLRRSRIPGLSIQISLEGASAASHDRVRGRGAFASALLALGRLAQGGLADRVTINFTEMSHNLHEFPDLLQLAEEKGLAAVVAGTLIKGGRAAADAGLAPPDSEQYLRLIERYDNEPDFRARYTAFGSMAALQWRIGEPSRHGFCTFADHPYLTADGRLYPCLMYHSDEYAVSGVYEKGLAAALIEGEKAWAPLLEISRHRFEELPQCSECPGADLCKGGCMGRALGSCGTSRSADDRCHQRRTIYTTFPPTGNLSVST